MNARLPVSTSPAVRRARVTPQPLHVVLYDVAAGTVRSVSDGISGFFAGWPQLAGPAEHGIPAAIAAEVRAMLAVLEDEHEAVLGRLIVPDLLAQVTVLAGPGPRYAVATFRRFETRDALGSAVRHYHLTPRETEVLALVLRGMRAAEIARRLGLSELTVGDYFKRLRTKSGARTQSGMLAAMLDATNASR